MKAVGFGQRAFGMALAAAILTGCGGAQIGRSVLVDGVAQARGHRSWMLPEAKNEDLIYVAIDGTSGPSYVSVYSYPAGKLVGTLTDFDEPWYECADKNGNVFIADTDAFRVDEYAHGGSAPINSLAVNWAKGCAVDPTTGNLAVMQENGGSVYVFEKAQGTPTVYTNSAVYFLSGITYDRSGDLFVNGDLGIRNSRVKRDASNGFAFFELPKDGKVFKPLTVNGYLNDSSQDPMQWDGKYLGLGSSGLRKHRRVGYMLVNRVKLTGSTGTIVEQVPLARDSHGQHNEFWINDDVAIQPSNERKGSYFEIFKYPSGKEIKKVDLPSVGFPEAIGVTLSVVPSHK